MDRYGFYIGEIVTAGAAIVVTLVGGSVVPFMVGWGGVAILFLVVRIVMNRRRKPRVWRDDRGLDHFQADGWEMVNRDGRFTPDADKH